MNCDILYNVTLLAFTTLKEGILNIPGIKYIPKGYINDNPKLINVSFIK